MVSQETLKVPPAWEVCDRTSASAAVSVPSAWRTVAVVPANCVLRGETLASVPSVRFSVRFQSAPAVKSVTTLPLSGN